MKNLDLKPVMIICLPLLLALFLEIREHNKDLVALRDEVFTEQQINADLLNRIEMRDVIIADQKETIDRFHLSFKNKRR